MSVRLLIILITTLALLVGCQTSKNPERGRDTREAVVNEFIAAIEANDLNAIHDLTSPRKEPTLDEIEAVLEPILGRPIEVAAISYITEFGPDTVNVLLEGSSGLEGRAKTPFTYRFYVSRLPGERWYLFITDVLQFGE